MKKSRRQRIEELGRVGEIISNQLDTPLEDISKETILGNKGLRADSLDLVELQICLEDEFDFKIPDDDAYQHIADRSTVGDVIAYIEKRLSY